MDGNWQISTNSQISIQDGMFIIDGQAYDLGTAMMKLNIDRTNELDKQIAGKMQDIKDKNDKVKMLNELLAFMRKCKAEGRDDDDDRPEWKGMKLTMNGQTKKAEDWAAELGVTSWTDVQYNSKERDAQWDANISAVQAVIDGLNSDSQIAMTQLQSLMNKRNTASDMTTNILSLDKKAKDSITSNMR